MVIQDIYNSIENLKSLEGIDYLIIGYSTFFRPIYVFHVGTYEGNQMLMEGGIHAREYLSTLFLIEEIKFLHEQFVNGELSGGYYVIPLVNPDGVALVLEGVSSVSCNIQKDILKLINNGSDDFSLWKANGLGVDLNVNFDAEWGKGTQNVFCLRSGNFVGYYPESEREVKILTEFTKQIYPSITISWHTKGEVIYYGFYTLPPKLIARDYQIALKISEVNGYSVLKTEGSVGGFSDWVSLNLEVPAFTIEIGNQNISHPLNEENLSVVFEQNKYVPIVALNAVNNV